MVKEYWIIKSENGKVMKDLTGNILFFTSALSAMMAIETDYHNSPYLKPEKWKNSRRDL